MLLLFFAGGGVAAPTGSTGIPGHSGRRKLKRPIWIGDRLAELIDGHSPQFVEEVAELVAEPEVVEPIEAPVEAPRFEEIREVAVRNGQEAQILSMFDQFDYALMLKLYESMLDEEDVEMLLLS